MNDITYFYKMLLQAARFYPAMSPPMKCKQLQAFRVLARDPRQNVEVGTDTIGTILSDKDTFFWSRKWELSGFNAGKISYEYPLLTAFELVNRSSYPMDGNNTKEYDIELSVLDTYYGESLKKNECENRSINQIYLDTEFMLTAVLRYIGGLVVASVNGGDDAIYNIKLLESVYPGQFQVKNHLGSAINAANRNVSFLRVEFPAKNIYGTKAKITVKALDCCNVDFEIVDGNDTVGVEPGSCILPGQYPNASQRWLDGLPRYVSNYEAIHTGGLDLNDWYLAALGHQTVQSGVPVKILELE